MVRVRKTGLAGLLAVPGHVEGQRKRGAHTANCPLCLAQVLHMSTSPQAIDTGVTDDVCG